MGPHIRKPTAPQIVQHPGSAFDHGLLRAVQPMRRDTGDDQARNELMVVACVLVYVYDGVGLSGRDVDVSNWDEVFLNAN